SQGPAPRQQVDNLPPTGPGDGVEYVGCSRRTRHPSPIFPYGNMSSRDSVAPTGDVLCLTAPQRSKLANRAEPVRKTLIQLRAAAGSAIRERELIAQGLHGICGRGVARQKESKWRVRLENVNRISQRRFGAADGTSWLSVQVAKELSWTPTSWY